MDSSTQEEESKPPGFKRLLVVGSVLAYLALLGLPVWWHTTSLHRPPLPHAAMQQVAAEAGNSTAYLPITLQLVLVLAAGHPHDPAAAEASQQLAADLHGSLTSAGFAGRFGTEVQLSVAVADQAGSCLIYPAATAAADTPCRWQWAEAPSLSSSAGMQEQQQLDQWLQQQLQKQQQPATGAAGHYHLFLLPSRPGDKIDSSSSSSSSALVVGRYRHAWLTYDPALAAAQQLHQLRDVAVAAAAQALSCCFALRAGPAGLAAAGSLPVAPSGHTHLSLSLLNADPASGPHFSWDMHAFERRYLKRVTDSLAPVTRVTVESQVLQFAAARLTGAWSSQHAAFVVESSQLPFFIDSEWSLESGRAVTPQEDGGHHSSAATCAAATTSTASAATQAAATSCAAAGSAAALVEPHVLQWVVYIPPKHHRPLQLLGPDGRVSEGNSYVIPSWGGLMVLNPADAAGNSSSSSGSGSSSGNGSGSSGSSSSGSGSRSSSSSSEEQWCGSTGAVDLTQQQYAHIAEVLVAQMQTLFGVAGAAAGSGGNTGSSSSNGSQLGQAGNGLRVQQLPAGRSGFNSWQVDALVRQRSAYDVREAARVLAALSTLVEELPNLEMPDLIGEQVTHALSAINSAWQHTAAGHYTAAAAAASAAHAAAEAAFSHPAVLTQLNFPDSHKLGVYMPLFLPLAVPLLQGLLGEIAHLRERRRGR